MEEEINTIKKENQMLKQLLKQDKDKIDYWVDIVEKALEFIREYNKTTMDEIPDALENILEGKIK